MQYKEYLKSDDWRNKKQKKYSKSVKRCSICGTTQDTLDVHHLNYKNLHDVALIDLRIFCRRCHELTHKLHKEGKIVFKNRIPNQMYNLIKAKVKKELGITHKNMFV